MLSRQLRDARLATGLTQQQAGAALKWPPPQLARIESGQGGPSAADLHHLLDLYQVHDPEMRARLETSVRQSRRPAGADALRGVFSEQEQRYVRHEGDAVRIRQYAAGLVPYLLRTQAYARTVIDATTPAGTPSRVLNRLLHACLVRQARLHRDEPPSLSFVIDEEVLLRPVGGAIVMAGQIERLHAEADRGTHLQILGLDAGAHPGLSGPFTLFDTTAGPVVSAAGHASWLLKTPAVVARYEQALTTLSGQASPPDDIHDVLDAAHTLSSRLATAGDRR